MSSHQRAWCHPHLSVSISTRIQQSLHNIRSTIASGSPQRCLAALQRTSHSERSDAGPRVRRGES